MIRNFPTRLPAKPLSRVLKFLRPLQFLIFTVLCLTLLTLNYLDTPFLKKARTSFDDLSGKIVHGLFYPIQLSKQFFSDVSSYFFLHQAYEDLLEENKKLLKWKDVAYQLVLENKKLTEALKVLPKAEQAYLTAPVLANYSRSYTKTLVIEGGQNQGIKEKQTVIYGDQIIGRILEAGDKTARVLLVTDVNSRIPVEPQTLLSKGILSGDEGTLLKLIHVQGVKHMRPGDHLYSTGEGGIFPKGLKVATIKKIQGEDITATTGLDLGALNYVQVLTNDSVSPP